MTSATAQIGSRAADTARYGSIARGNKRALRWSYFFLTLFVIFFLMPPVYMFITSIKSKAEIAAAPRIGNMNSDTLAPNGKSLPQMPSVNAQVAKTCV